jgi:GT2 family glycosyltransferase
VDPVCTVIIPTYNRRDTLVSCLAHLEASTVGPERLQVVVVDDGSSDGSLDAVAARRWRFDELIPIAQANAGPAAARNRGLAVARAPLTLFINDDTLVAPDNIEVHLDEHAAREASGDSRVMVQGTFDFVPDFAATPLGTLLATTPHLFYFCLLQPGDECTADFAATCNLTVPTVAARRVGFDEGFRGPAGEDVEFARRLADEGWYVKYQAEARSLHDHWLSVTSLQHTVRVRGRGGGRLIALRGASKELISTLVGARGSEAALERGIADAARRLDGALGAAGAGEPLPEMAYESLATMFQLGLILGCLDDADLAARLN